MKKRFVGRTSASLANGRVVFPGDIVDIPAKEWQGQSHIPADQFIDVEDAPAPDVAEDAPAPAPAKRTKSSDKE